MTQMTQITQMRTICVICVICGSVAPIRNCKDRSRRGKCAGSNLKFLKHGGGWSVFLRSPNQNPVVDTGASRRPSSFRAKRDGSRWDWLLRPHSRDAFLQDCWEQTPYLIGRNDASYYADLFSMEDMDALISVTRPHTDIVVVRSERGVRSSAPIERDISGAPNIYWLYGMYHAGYTIIVNGAELRWPPIGELCRNLESELGHRVSANLYFTPSGAQGFLPHFDDHEVLILQIEGSKQWSLFQPPTELPLPETALQVDTGRLGRARKLTVRAGDLLYVPRGVVHHAVAARKPSIHLTIGIHVTRWIDVIIDVMRMKASQDVRWRKALPVGSAQDKTDVLVGHLQQLLKTIPGEGDCHRALRERKDRFLACGRPMPDISAYAVGVAAGHPRARAPAEGHTTTKGVNHLR